MRQRVKERETHLSHSAIARARHLFFSDDNKGSSFTNNKMNFSCYWCNHSRNGMFRKDEWKSLDASQKRVCAYLCKWLSTKLKVWALKVGRSVSRLLTLHMGRLLGISKKIMFLYCKLYDEGEVSICAFMFSYLKKKKLDKFR